MAGDGETSHGGKKGDSMNGKDIATVLHGRACTVQSHQQNAPGCFWHGMAILRGEPHHFIEYENGTTDWVGIHYSITFTDR